MKITPNSKLVFIGDSVTDCGRAQPIGDGRDPALGNGYVSYIAALLGAANAEERIRVVNVGTSGNTVLNLAERWQRDVLDIRPDWLSVMIGINDVWRQFDSPLHPERAVDLPTYEATLRRLVTQTRPVVKGLVLMTPFYIEPNPTDAMRARMDEYGAAVARIARETDGAILVDTQAAFNAVLRYVYPALLAWDRVHPSQVGHMILARAFLQAIEFEW